MTQPDNTTPHNSSNYDEQVRKVIPYYDFFHAETINLIKAACPQPKKWLDTGCGTGTLIEKAAPQFPNTHFVLCDPSPQMLNVAKQKLQRLPNISFLEVAPTENLGNLKTRFDVITAIQSHHYLLPQRRVEVTKTCYRLLAKKGVYVTFENIRSITEVGTEIGKENWRQFEIRSGKTVEAAKTHLQRFGVDYFPITVAEHLALLRENGFSTVELLWYSVMQAGFYAVK